MGQEFCPVPPRMRMLRSVTASPWAVAQRGHRQGQARHVGAALCPLLAAGIGLEKGEVESKALA